MNRTDFNDVEMAYVDVYPILIEEIADVVYVADMTIIERSVDGVKKSSLGLVKAYGSGSYVFSEYTYDYDRAEFTSLKEAEEAANGAIKAYTAARREAINSERLRIPIPSEQFN